MLHNDQQVLTSVNTWLNIITLLHKKIQNISSQTLQYATLNILP
jgi:hypothetical protein